MGDFAPRFISERPVDEIALTRKDPPNPMETGNARDESIVVNPTKTARLNPYHVPVPRGPSEAELKKQAQDEEQRLAREAEAARPKRIFDSMYPKHDNG
jgi:hypothetical protein